MFAVQLYMRLIVHVQLYSESNFLRWTVARQHSGEQVHLCAWVSCGFKSYREGGNSVVFLMVNLLEIDRTIGRKPWLTYDVNCSYFSEFLAAPYVPNNGFNQGFGVNSPMRRHFYTVRICDR